MRFCATRAERLRIQRRDKMFAAGNGSRFRTPLQRKSRCSKLMVEGEIIGDTEPLLREWTGHFSKLAKSKVVTMPGLVELQGKVEVLASQSAENEEMLLDVPFSAEEVAAAVKRLKNRKAAGPDGLTAEHLEASGETSVIWLMNILNAVVE